MVLDADMTLLVLEENQKLKKQCEKKAAFPDEKEWLLSEIVTTLFFWADKFEKRFQHNA